MVYYFVFLSLLYKVIPFYYHRVHPFLLILTRPISRIKYLWKRTDRYKHRHETLFATYNISTTKLYYCAIDRWYNGTFYTSRVCLALNLALNAAVWDRRTLFIWYKNCTRYLIIVNSTIRLAVFNIKYMRHNTD